MWLQKEVSVQVEKVKTSSALGGRGIKEKWVEKGQKQQNCRFASGVQASVAEVMPLLLISLRGTKGRRIYDTNKGITMNKMSV